MNRLVKKQKYNWQTISIINSSYLFGFLSSKNDRHSQIPSFWNFFGFTAFLFSYVKIHGRMVGQNKTFEDGTGHAFFTVF